MGQTVISLWMEIQVHRHDHNMYYQHLEIYQKFNNI